MIAWWWSRGGKDATPAVEDRLRQQYISFRQLLTLNNECLELLAGLQEDLRDVPPHRDVIGDRISGIFDKAGGIVTALERLTGKRQSTLAASLRAQRREVEGHIVACQERDRPRLSAWLSDIDMHAVQDVGGKAAALGEIRNKLSLPVPNGYVLTTEAYRRFCGIPLWRSIRDALRDADLNDLAHLQSISTRLKDLVLACPLPRPIEVAITARAQALDIHGHGLAVRSSALGEGGEKTFAGQFLSLLNVRFDQLVDAYKRVVAERFSERALSYRLSTGLPEVESPMAVLFLPVIQAHAAGILYTRDPKNPKSDSLWISSTWGLGLEIASGQTPSDLFVVSRRNGYDVLEQNIVRKQDELVLRPNGGVMRRTLEPDKSIAASLEAAQLRTLAAWGVRLEEHFKTPQDVEWVLDENGNFWILQSRPLVLAGSSGGRVRIRGRREPVLSGGRPVYPGRVSGPAYLVEEPQALTRTPEGAVVFMRRVSPDIVEVFPRIAGLVAEWGNVAGHGAALLREFKVPSVFEMSGAFERLETGDAVSLDATSGDVYRGSLWPQRQQLVSLADRYPERAGDPISRRLLALHLLDPGAFRFRPSGCRSAHDVIRYCHEKAVEAMFAVNDRAIEYGPRRCKRLLAGVPVNLHVLDLGGGLVLEDPDAPDVRPSQIVSRPFQSLWKGVCHPEVTWTRQRAPSFGDLASVMAESLTSAGSAVRALGEKSYLLVADEYMNLNSRLAYHYTLVDACVSDVPAHNYISFRFAGGGAPRQRRSLRACFIEACLTHYGFSVDRRGDLVNAWFKREPAPETESRLDILGRLMACTSQLDMYMTSHDVMKWHVQQFLTGNYTFHLIGKSEQLLQNTGTEQPQ